MILHYCLQFDSLSRPCLSPSQIIGIAPAPLLFYGKYFVSNFCGWFNKLSWFQVRPVVGLIEFPILENLRTLLLDECDLRDNFRLLRHFLRSSPNLEKLTVRLCKVILFCSQSIEIILPNLGCYGWLRNLLWWKQLPKVSPEGKGKARSGKGYCQFQNLVRFKCQKLKSTEIIYKNGSKIQGLVSLFLGISDCAPKNTVTLKKYEGEEGDGTALL